MNPNLPFKEGDLIVGVNGIGKHIARMTPILSESGTFYYYLGLVGGGWENADQYRKVSATEIVDF